MVRAILKLPDGSVIDELIDSFDQVMISSEDPYVAVVYPIENGKRLKTVYVAPENAAFIEIESKEEEEEEGDDE